MTAMEPDVRAFHFSVSHMDSDWERGPVRYKRVRLQLQTAVHSFPTYCCEQ